MALVNVRPQTDQIYDVACGTSDGLSLNFSTIDVGNTLFPEYVVATIRSYGEKYDEYLVKDKIRHQIQVICATMTFHEVFNTRFHEIDDLLSTFLTESNYNLSSNLAIDFVRLAKPSIPAAIATSFVQLAEESTMFKVETERQHRLQKEAETREKTLQSELSMDLQRSQQENRIQVSKMETKEGCEKIENRMREERAKTDANAQKLHAEALQELYAIPRYSEYLIAQEFANGIKENSKFFFGPMPTNQGERERMDLLSCQGLKKDKVHIRNQQRNGKKTLTTIQGLNQDLDLKKLLRFMRKSFSTNGTIIDDDSFGQVIQLQGDKRDDAMQFLIAFNICAKEDITVHGA